MVFLSELSSQWPWNQNAPKDYTDKEIYTQVVSPAFTNEEWVIPVHPPMPGYAYIGLRIAVAGKPESYCVSPRFVIGNQRFPIFGHPYDIQHCTNTKWSLLSFPMVPRLFQQSEKGTVNILVAHDTPCFGKVELLAQKFEDLLEDDSQITYGYYDILSDNISWIHTPDEFYTPNNMVVVPKRCKILAPLQSILHKVVKEINDPYQVGVHVEKPFA
jgi:hypothetical protein